MSSQDNEGKEPSKLAKILFEDVFLLFILGLVVPGVIYTLWGVIDLMSVMPVE